MARNIDESFEGTGYEESWTEQLIIGNANNLVAEDTAIPGTAPAGAGTQCLRIYKNNTDNNHVYAYHAFGSTWAQRWARVYVRIAASNLADAAATQIIFVGGGDNQSPVLGIQLGYTAAGTQYWLRMTARDSGTTWNYSSAKNISLDTWYRVEFRWNTGSSTNNCGFRVFDASESEIGSEVQMSLTLDSTSRPPNSIACGVFWSNALTIDAYYDLVVVDDADWVGAEEEEEPTGPSKPILMHYYRSRQRA